jgi:5-methylcytosine-specific restriction endonuclease McrA
MPAKDYNAYMAAYMLRRYYERRAEAIEILGGCCAQCGAVEEDMIFDHVNWRDKSFPISKLWSVSRARFLAELAKCQLLCPSCDKEKTRGDLREIRAEQGWKNQYGSGPMIQPS